MQLFKRAIYNNYQLAVITANLFLVAFHFIYLALRYAYLNSNVPMWYTINWGDNQLAEKHFLYLLPISAAVSIVAGVILFNIIHKYYVRYAKELILLCVSALNIALYLSTLRIINIASEPYPPLVSPILVELLFPMAFSALVVLVMTPKFLEFAKRKGIVTDPKIHFHPGMLLIQPSARGGGVVFTISLLITSFLFITPNKQIIGILLGAALIAGLGYIDDYQNTHQKSILKKIENPIIRLGLLFATVTFIVVAFDLSSSYIGNPSGGIINFSNDTVSVAGKDIKVVATVFTVLWIVWILNLLSWSNGIDGQYSGIIGIIGIVIAILALRFTPLSSSDINFAKLAIIASGASLGLAYFTWYPSKIMWGFGAMSAGIVIASISILINSKIATSILILMVPFLDASVTFIRRVVQKKFPLKGDRGHLHHLLLERGWSVKRIALFYWITTAAFGAIGLLSSENATVQIALTLGGIVGFIIVILNVQSITKKKRLPMLE